uniref:PRKR-interacting protein 1 n=1 Tax=Laticauda laticaudata TaxID=8630 RepID=A0A8C5RPW5_LATLA
GVAPSLCNIIPPEIRMGPHSSSLSKGNEDLRLYPTELFGTLKLLEIEMEYFASAIYVFAFVFLTGSSAGAGSGEFHVYRHLRRREYQRQDFMDAMAEKQKLDEEYQKKLEKNKIVAEEQTAKRRKKRMMLRKKENSERKRKAWLEVLMAWIFMIQ